MTDPANAPGHTDLMVSPESIGAWLEANPLPDKPKVGRPRGVKRDEAVRLLRLGHSWQSLISRGIPRHTVYEARVELRRRTSRHE